MTLARHLPPVLLPILFFLAVICAGAVVLHLGPARAAGPLSWTDAFFTATSATCVTGLIVVDTGAFFSRFGQSVILLLIQLGGLGIMTFTGLFFYLWRKRVSITDRVAVGQSLLHDPAFHLGAFLQRIVLWTLVIELAGAVALFVMAPAGFSPYGAVFHAVSAFCNAGFSLQPDSLTAWRDHLPVNLVFMALIILGGLGFSVLTEIQARVLPGGGPPAARPPLSWHAGIVVRTSLFLVAGGGAAIFLAEHAGGGAGGISPLAAVFQSVTCRTAGFNTVDPYGLSNVSLLVMAILMFIGGGPGSCAGGIKITSFRVITGFIGSQLRGRDQTVIGRYAVQRETLHKTLMLVIFAGTLVVTATLLLSISEGGGSAHPVSRGLSLEILFEVVSAFGTVGLSTGLTPHLTGFGKWLVILLMFVGRLGPLIFLAAIHTVRRERRFRWPEENLLIG